MNWLPKLLGEDIDAALRRKRQQLITPRRQIARPQLIETRVRNPERRRKIVRQPVIGHPDAIVNPEHFVSSRRRSMPSRCNTAAWAARHDQMVERVLAFAQSTIPASSRQNGSSASVAACGSAPVTINPSMCRAVDIGDVGVLRSIRHFAVAIAARTAVRSSGNRCEGSRRLASTGA